MTLQEKKPVQIELTSRIRRSHSASLEESKLAVTGDLFYKNEYYYLIYRENLENVGQVTNTLKFREKEATILRQGAISMRQHLIPGKTISGTYQHPHGQMEIKTKATDIRFQIDEEKGSGTLLLQYKMDIQGKPVGRYKLLFDIKEVHHDSR